MEDKKLLW